MQFFGQWDKPLLSHGRISIARWPYRFVQRVIKKTVRLVTCLMMFLVSPETIANTSAAFFYGKPVPIDLLSRFEQIIVEPDNIDDISQLVAKGGQVFAYLSIGEINPNRKWFSEIPKDWLVGDNTAWGSHIIDLSNKAWQDYLITKLMRPLWEKGYRGFFLDTLDSYQLAISDQRQWAKQRQALSQLIRSMHERFPGIRLIANRGFDLLPDIAKYIAAVAAESLFQSWNADTKTYVEVLPKDRDWLLGKLNQAHDEYGLQVIVIDYVPPNQRGLAQEVADKITNLGFTPWVTNPALDMVGIGNIDVSTKHILILVNDEKDQLAVQSSMAHKLYLFFFNKMGYEFHYLDINKGLPSQCLAGQFSSIVQWRKSAGMVQDELVKAWLTKQENDGIAVYKWGKYSL